MRIDQISRRDMTKLAAAALLASPALFAAQPGKPVTNSSPAPKPVSKPDARATPAALSFKISLAQWSLHRALQSKSLDHLDFPKTAKNDYGIDAVEYVNVFFKSAESAYVEDLKKRCADLGVRSVLIMCDGEGALGDADKIKRLKAVDNHRKWIDAATILGCHSIRVNAQSSGTFEEQQERAADGLRRLADFGGAQEINVIVENHGGLSSNGEWLAGVMRLVNSPRMGTLPDFGNFNLGDGKQYDRYKGIAELMPFAKGVSAKSYDFDDATGEEKTIDYHRMMRIVLSAGYHNHLGVEYEGDRLSEPDGIRATKRLLEKVRDEIATENAGKK